MEGSPYEEWVYESKESNVTIFFSSCVIFGKAKAATFLGFRSGACVCVLLRLGTLCEAGFKGKQNPHWMSVLGVPLFRHMPPSAAFQQS